jgi:adenine deaminase
VPKWPILLLKSTKNSSKRLVAWLFEGRPPSMLEKPVLSRCNFLSKFSEKKRGRNSMKREPEMQPNGREALEADLFLEGGEVLNVYSGEILESNVAIRGRKILYVGPRSDSLGKRALRRDMARKVLVPGYVEPHCHPWNLYNPLSFGEEACRLGTTTLVCDNLIF